jgi:DNA polymerase-3 subunit epsilon
MNLLSLDFETADHGADSACSVGLVRIEGGRIVETAHRLIRPPRRRFAFTYIHGISWRDVAAEPTFGEVWADLGRLFDGADYLVAHYAPFDRGVLRACCAAAGVPAPAAPFVCTVKLARAAWNVRPTKLPDVCRHLGLDLRHHDAASDALACARIALAAVEQGCPIGAGLLGGPHPNW